MTRQIRVWAPLSAELVNIQMSEYQLAALISFLRTGEDAHYPNWPSHFADELDGKARIDAQRIR